LKAGDAMPAINQSFDSLSFLSDGLRDLVAAACAR
jgi:hypothetical protein